MNTIQLINKVLLELGEREVTSVDENPASRKVYGMLQETIDAVNYEQPWEELCNEVVVNTLTNGTASSVFSGSTVKALPTRIHSVERVVDLTTKSSLQFIDPYKYTNSTQTNIWTTWRNNLILKTSIALTNLSAIYHSSFTLPLDINTDLPASDYLVQLYSMRLLMKAAARHLNNFDLASLVFQEYAAGLLAYNVTTKMSHTSRLNQRPSFPPYNSVPTNGSNPPQQRS